jgi:hypothetical protein
VKPTRIISVLKQLLKQRWPAFLWGPPGIGKSSVVKSVALAADLSVIDLRASLLDPTDLRGIPTIQNGEAVWCPPSFLPRATDRPGILFLDEINAAPPLVQASLYQLVLDRQIGEYRLPEGWSIVAAGNRQTDRAVVFRLSSALANRFIHLDFESDIDDWRAWAIAAGINPLVVGFIATRPELLCGIPGDAVAFPTPRSWEMISDVVRAHGDDIESCWDVIPGIVGEAAAIEFQGYVSRAIREEDLRKIVSSPKTAPIPESMSDIFAMTSWFAYHNKEKEVRTAGAVLLSRIPPEFAVILARDLLKASPTLVIEPGYKDFIKKHGKLLLG